VEALASIWQANHRNFDSKRLVDILTVRAVSKMVKKPVQDSAKS
jgi:hypothetical protein